MISFPSSTNKKMYFLLNKVIKNVGVASETFICQLNYNKQFHVSSLENKSQKKKKTFTQKKKKKKA